MSLREDSNITPIKKESIKTIPINSASVRVMRSFDYSHFEITLGCSSDEQGNPVSLLPEDIDQLRKNAARLADKAVAQYKVSKQAHQADESSWNSMRYSAEQANKTPESERTPEEKAAIKALADARFEQRHYDYQDDWDDLDDQNRY